MNRFSSAHWICIGLAVLLVDSAARAAEFSPAVVAFAPGYEAALQAKYGAQEAPALRSEIVDSISTALKAARGDCNLNLDVIMERIAPSHLTIKQQLDDPAMDPLRSVFLNGGAELTHGSDRKHGHSSPMVVGHQRILAGWMHAKVGGTGSA